MITANYSVIKYIADPGRDEPANIGVLIWTDHECRLKLDPAALSRVTRENPDIPIDAVDHIEPVLRDRLRIDNFSPDHVNSVIDCQRGYPWLIADPGETYIRQHANVGLEDAADQIIRRMVRPRNRPDENKAPQSRNPVVRFQRRFRGLIETNLVVPDYEIRETASGRRRTVDFYGDTKSNVALNALKLDIRDQDRIEERADAEAFAVRDILTKHDGLTLLIYIAQSKDPAMLEINRWTRKTLEHEGARVMTDFDQAADLVERAVRA